MKELNDFRKFLQENELHEGTWSLGTVDAMNDVLAGLANIRDKADLAMDPNNKGKGFVDGFKMALNNEAFDARMYRVFGDDSFHDYIAAARREAEVGNFDGAKNSLGDALARGLELLKYQQDYEKDRFEEGDVETALPGEEGYDSEALALKQAGLEEGMGDKLMAKFRKRRAAKKEKERFTKGLDMKMGGAPEIDPEFTKGLEENDAVLDEMAQSMGIFREIDMMVGDIKDQMSPDDAFDSLVSEFEAISGGTKLLHRALKNISLDNNLGEIRSAYNESLNEDLTKDILKKHPKKYKDEKAVKVAAAKLMKSPKFKGKGIGPVLQALLKGKE